MTLSIVLVLLIAGSWLFSFLSPWWFSPLASNWSSIDSTISITNWVTGIVFVLVNLFVAYAVFRFRYRAGGRSHYEPENKKLEWQLMGLTTVGIVVLLAPGLYSWAKVVDVPKDAAIVEVVGKQWHWSYRFPGKDGVLGTVNPRYVSDANPFGVNAEDPNGKDDILVSSQELHLPIGKPVRLLLRSTDVLHDFAVAQFRVKMDFVPGMVTQIWLTPTRTGTFDILCEELCGIGHFAMRGKVTVEDEQKFQTWLTSFPTFAQSMAQVAGDAAAGQAGFAVCAACHGTQGEGNPALHAPKLSGQQDWYLKRQIKYFKQGIRGAHADDEFGKMMAPMAATMASDADIDNVVAYIKTLPDNPAPRTLQGSSARAQQRFATCAACHGAGGEGVRAMNAPRLAGMSDWYLSTQLKNFKRGIRGTHAGDEYGDQMSLMVGMLSDDKQIDDLAAYVGSLAASGNRRRAEESKANETMAKRDR